MSEEKQPHLLSRDFKVDVTEVQMTHFIRVRVGVTPKHILAPEFWANTAHHLRPDALINAMPDDSSYLAQFIVKSVGANWARVELNFVHSYVTAESVLEKARGFEVKWGNPKTLHRVWRLSDNSVLKDGFATPEQAHEWLAANLEAMTA